MRRQHEDDLVRILLFVLAGEEIFEERDLRQTREARETLDVRIFQDAAQ